MSKGVQIAGGATLVALLLGWYAASNLEAGASFAYFKTLSEFQAAQPELIGHHARVHGYVALGSIQRDVAAKQVRFHVQGEPPHAGGAPGQPLEVVFGSLETPDLFKDGAEVVVEGRLSEAGDVFHADKVMAKCPSKFESAAGGPAAI
ncbi:MAG TPA: cytochrome c maturation protein CcmE [Myxococcota bacterium]|jgi:cytochrome c-type biogenesis protein CcmE